MTVVAHGRSLFPDRLLGRGVTTLNLAQLVGASVMPIPTGAVAAAFIGDGAAAGTNDPGAAYPEAAYRAMFALIATRLAAARLLHSRGADAPPRPSPA